MSFAWGLYIVLGSVFGLLIYFAVGKHLFRMLGGNRSRNPQPTPKFAPEKQWTALYEEGELSYKEMQALIARQNERDHNSGQKDPPPAWEDD